MSLRQRLLSWAAAALGLAPAREPSGSMTLGDWRQRFGHDPMPPMWMANVGDYRARWYQRRCNRARVFQKGARWVAALVLGDEDTIAWTNEDWAPHALTGMEWDGAIADNPADTARAVDTLIAHMRLPDPERWSFPDGVREAARRAAKHSKERR